MNTWNLTAVADKSYLVKKITANMAPGFAWNDAANHRSYWAIIPSTVNLLYNSYAQATSTVNAAANYLYCQENTTDDGTAPLAGERTQVIVMATLCDKTGAAMEIAEWRGVRMTKADLCASIVSCPQIKEYNLNAADLAFTTVSAYKNNSAAVTDVAKLEASKRYLVVAQLTESAAATAADKAAEINTALAALGDMKIWADGKAYYYFDIAHDTATEGGATIYGVVRNHVYNATLNSVAGLGTPVFDPEEPIIPEKIQEDESYLAAEIKVLAWKVVNQGVDL